MLEIKECKLIDFLLKKIKNKTKKHFQWPYCDGAHGAHNKETGDNAGPIVVKRKAT